MKSRIGCIAAIVMGLLLGCAGPQLESNVQEFSVVQPPQDVTAEEAIAFIKATDELNKAKEDSASLPPLEGNPINSDSNHPSIILQSDEPFSDFTIRQGESLLSVVNRLVNTANFTRLIVDLSAHALSPDRVFSTKASRTIGGETLFGEVAAIYDGQIPNLGIYVAEDKQGHALVVSDKGYKRWERLGVFEVQGGTLKGNAIALANYIGWHLDVLSGWRVDDYPVTSRYPLVIVVNEPRQAFTALLHRYPAQAQLNPNTKHITVVARLHPINKGVSR